MEKGEYDSMYLVEDTHFWYRGMQSITKALIENYKPGQRSLKILDAGCGTGAGAQWLSSYGKTYGIDVSPFAIKLCKKRGLKNVFVAGIEKIPFPNNSFDIVASFDVLGQMEVQKDYAAVREFYRVLRPGGILILRTAAFNWLSSYHDTAVHTKHRYTAYELKNLLKNNIFTVQRATYANMFLFPVSVIMRITGRLLASSNTSSDVKPINPLLNRLLYIPLWLESRIIRYADLPLGLSVIVVAKK